MNEFNENLDADDEVVVPDAGIVKFSNGTYCVIKFVIEDNEMVAYTTEIAQEDLNTIDAVKEIDEHSILFVKIHYEFQFDEDSGVMEMQLSRMVTLTDAMTDNPVLAQDIIETSPEDLILVYLDVIKSL